MRKRIINIILISVSLLLFSSCGFIAGMLIASSYNAKLTINERFVESSHGLTNGIYFEKLIVLEKDENGIPKDYVVTQRFRCFNPGVDGVQEYWPKKLYFDQANGHYLWEADTAALHFIQNGRNRATIPNITNNDSISNGALDFFSEEYIDSYDTFEICPVKLQVGSWYYIDFYDPVLSAVFLFIESKNEFRLYKVGSGVSPI